MRTLRLAALVFLAALALTGCASKIQTIKIQTDDPDHIWLQHFVAPDGTVVAQGYNHPAKLDPAVLKNMLVAVDYEEYSFFAWRKVNRVFTDPEIKTLQGALAQALAQATPDQWVHFAITGMKREFLSITPTRHLTDGVCFVKDGKFHLVIGNLNFEMIQSDRELWRRDPRDRFYFDSIRLASDPARGIDIPAIVDGDKWFKKRRVNWLVFDIAKFQQPETTPAPAPVPTADATERLKKLKELLDQGLISPEEYEQKRKEILGGL